MQPRGSRNLNLVMNVLFYGDKLVRELRLKFDFTKTEWVYLVASYFCEKNQFSYKDLDAILRIQTGLKLPFYEHNYEYMNRLEDKGFFIFFANQSRKSRVAKFYSLDRKKVEILVKEVEDCVLKLGDQLSETLAIEKYEDKFTNAKGRKTVGTFNVQRLKAQEVR